MKTHRIVSSSGFRISCVEPSVSAIVELALLLFLTASLAFHTY